MMSLHPRECTLVKEEGENYGFCLRIERFKTGHLIRNVEKDSPAEKAGLKDGDRVLKINGVFIDKEDHGEVGDISFWFFSLMQSTYFHAPQQPI